METNKKPRAGSAVLVKFENKFLLGKRNKKNCQGKWVIPGGGINFGETAEEAGKREIKEEANINIKIGKFLGVKEIINLAGDYHGIVFFHLAKALNPHELKPSEDVSEVGFFTIDQIKKMNCVLSVQEILEEAGFWVNS